MFRCSLVCYGSAEYLVTIGSSGRPGKQCTEPVVSDICWDLIPWWNQLGIDSYEELG
jgi:hypothetical protein